MEMGDEIIKRYKYRADFPEAMVPLHSEMAWMVVLA